MFSRDLPLLGGASRMSRIFPHLVLLHVVSDGFHLGGEEGSGPGFILCVELLGSVYVQGVRRTSLRAI